MHLCNEITATYRTGLLNCMISLPMTPIHVLIDRLAYALWLYGV